VGATISTIRVGTFADMRVLCVCVVFLFVFHYEYIFETVALHFLDLRLDLNVQYARKYNNLCQQQQ
jgi:hypothetical protein